MKAYICEIYTREEIICENCQHGVFDVDEETEEAVCDECGWYCYDEFYVDVEV